MIDVTVQSIPITVTVQDQAPITVSISAVGTPGPAGTNGTNGTNGVGVPIGGTAGQALSKIDATDYNTQWTTPGLIAQTQVNSQVIPTGYSTTVQTRYQITGTQNLTIQGTGIFAVR